MLNAQSAHDPFTRAFLRHRLIWSTLIIIDLVWQAISLSWMMGGLITLSEMLLLNLSVGAPLVILGLLVVAYLEVLYLAHGGR